MCEDYFSDTKSPNIGDTRWQEEAKEEEFKDSIELTKDILFRSRPSILSKTISIILRKVKVRWMGTLSSVKILQRCWGYYYDGDALIINIIHETEGTKDCSFIVHSFAHKMDDYGWSDPKTSYYSRKKIKFNSIISSQLGRIPDSILRQYWIVVEEDMRKLQIE